MKTLGCHFRESYQNVSKSIRFISKKECDFAESRNLIKPMENGCLGHPPKGTLKGLFKQSNSIRKFDFLKAAGGCCLGGGLPENVAWGGTLLETFPPPKNHYPPQDYSRTVPVLLSRYALWMFRLSDFIKVL